jgi:hypothetical protein
MALLSFAMARGRRSLWRDDNSMPEFCDAFCILMGVDIALRRVSMLAIVRV